MKDKLKMQIYYHSEIDGIVLILPNPQPMIYWGVKWQTSNSIISKKERLEFFAKKGLEYIGSFEIDRLSDI